MNIHKPIQLLIMAAFIAACGGGGGGDGNGGQSPNIGGVWTGTFTNNIYLCIIFVCVLDHTDTRPAMVSAAPDRRFHLIPRDVFSLSGLQPYEQTQYVGRLQVSGNAVSGRLDRVGATCLDNTGTGEFVRDQAIIDASVATGVALDGDWELDRCIGDGVFNLDYDTASSEPASLAAVSGLWLGGDLAIHIDNNGTVTGSNSSGCQFAGSVAPVDPAINIYEFEIAINNYPSTQRPAWTCATRRAIRWPERDPAKQYRWQDIDRQSVAPESVRDDGTGSIGKEWSLPI